MAVSKRTRFEVLRRDKFRCQYCGLKATETGDGLTVDHVMPISLGGSDKPDNLVAACRDCNSGKSSIGPDSPIVQGVADRAAAYALGMLDRMTTIRGEIQTEDYFIDWFESQWNSWTRGGKTFPLPADYRQSVTRWYRMGVPNELFQRAIEAAANKPFLKGSYGEFSYMAGVIWRTLDDKEIDYTLDERTVRTFTKFELEDYGLGEYDRGVEDGQVLEQSRLVNQDFTQLVIDGQFDHWAMREMTPVD